GPAMTRFFVSLSAWLLLAPAAPAQDQLAAQARRVFEKSCHRCHKGEGSQSGYAFDVLRRDTLLATGEGNDKPYLTPGDPDKSKLWERVADGSMPFRRSPELEGFRPEDKETLRRWIVAGAPDFPREERRKFVGLAAVLTAIRDDLG